VRVSRCPVLRAPYEPDVVSAVPPPLSCSDSVLQALGVLPRLEQVRPPSCIPPCCCMSVLPRVVMRRLRLMCASELPAAAADSCSLSPGAPSAAAGAGASLLVCSTAVLRAP